MLVVDCLILCYFFIYIIHFRSRFGLIKLENGKRKHRMFHILFPKNNYKILRIKICFRYISFENPPNICVATGYLNKMRNH